METLLLIVIPHEAIHFSSNRIFSQLFRLFSHSFSSHINWAPYTEVGRMCICYWWWHYFCVGIAPWHGSIRMDDRIIEWIGCIFICILSTHRHTVSQSVIWEPFEPRTIIIFLTFLCCFSFSFSIIVSNIRNSLEISTTIWIANLFINIMNAYLEC